MKFERNLLYDGSYNCGPTLVPESGKSFNEICTLDHQQWRPTTPQMLSGWTSPSSMSSSKAMPGALHIITAVKMHSKT